LRETCCYITSTKTKFADYQLIDYANLWWDHFKKKEKVYEENLDWDTFKNHFEYKYQGDMY